jgi:hypothetical protein
MAFSKVNKTVFATLVLALSASAQGATTWNFSGAGGWDNSQTYTSGADSVTVKSYIEDSWGDLDQGKVYSWSGGLGAKKVSEDSNYKHTTDNYKGEFEAILFDFGAGNLFAMNSVSVGWYEHDSDLSVIALTDPSLGGANLESLSWSELLDNGWEDVAVLPDVGVNTATFNDDANPDNNVSARYWMVGVYNPLLYGLKAGQSYAGWWDGVKIGGAGGVYHKPPPPPVPEPATLLMITLGLGFVGTRRKLLKA